MKTAEMIEVMQAYQRGEKIEWKQGDDKWFDCNGTPDWAWDKRLYRIKPKPLPTPKFKEKDSIVYIDDKGRQTPYITEIVSVGELYYMARELGSSNEPISREILRVDKNHINADDVLWYWEFQSTDGDWHKTDCRYTREQAKSKIINAKYATLTPLYALGFRLKDEK